MIARIEGVLRERAPTRVVVDVGGVGYELLIPLSTFVELPETGKTIGLHVHTHVRAEAFQLFGFVSVAEKAVFELLLKASRIGPKVAQGVLSGAGPQKLLAAIRDGDVKTLSSAPGVGKKMAERIAVELREKAAELALELGASEAVGGPGGAPGEGDARDEVVSALVNLGYPKPHAEKVADEAAREAGEEASIESLIRVALRRLAR